MDQHNLSPPSQSVGYPDTVDYSRSLQAAYGYFGVIALAETLQPLEPLPQTQFR